MEETTVSYGEDQEQLIKNLNTLDLSSSEFAHRLGLWGDNRKPQTIVRSIQRMKSNEIPISGEMTVIVNMLLARQKEIHRSYSDITWEVDANGVVSSVIDDHKVALQPYSRGRWVINVTHPTGYCPPWPTFPKTLADAKRKALVMVEDTKAYFATSELE